YGGDAAIRFMGANVKGAEGYDDDQILNLIDIIFDYYDENGDLEIDCDDEDADDAAAIAAHAAKLLAKDPGNEIRPEHIEPLVAAEIEYELSLI
ncbi:MAG: hypothetical protein K2F97_04415, partial [Muribaculaceae bacterium]|nr:hypothetical protein [Muribaculaceae bacterium]